MLRRSIIVEALFMATIAIIAALIWTPGLTIGAGAWIATRVSRDARRWVGQQLFG